MKKFEGYTEEPLVPTWVSLAAGLILVGFWLFAMLLGALCTPLGWVIHL